VSLPLNWINLFIYCISLGNHMYDSVTTGIDHFTVVRPVARPPNESEAGVDPVLTGTSLLLLCKFLLISMRTASLA